MLFEAAINSFGLSSFRNATCIRRFHVHFTWRILLYPTVHQFLSYFLSNWSPLFIFKFQSFQCFIFRACLCELFVTEEDWIRSGIGSALILALQLEKR